MTSNLNLDAVLADLELKRAASTDLGQRPTIDVAAALAGRTPHDFGTTVVDELGHEQVFAPELPARLIADAISTVGVATGDLEVDTVENRALIAGITEIVCERLCGEGLAACPVTVSSHDLSTLVEAALLEVGEREFAKALVLRRALPSVSSPDALRRVKIVRRSGQVVSWNGGKIEHAVRAAFLSAGHDPTPATVIAARVTERACTIGLAYVPIEIVQDLVQEELVLGGHMRIAERFIVYRAERAMQRARERATEGAVAASELEPTPETIEIVEENGSTTLWNGDDLRDRIRFAVIGLDLPMDSARIERELRRSLGDGITRVDLRRLVVLNAKALVEKDPDFSKLAGRILLTWMYEETLDWQVGRDGLAGLADAHRRKFRELLEYGVSIGRTSADLLTYDLDRLAAAIDPTADLDFEFLGLQTLYDRYLLVDKTEGRAKHHKRIETPQLFWMRVAMGVSLVEEGDREARVLDLYGVYRDRRFCSSTPTLFNSGTPHSQMSSCYLYVIEDSLESIVQRGVADNAQLSKWAGGLGGSWANVRGTGSHIGGTNGESQGVVPFLKLHNDQLVAVNQGGKRAGSGCAYLETWHNDILDFLELRKNTGDERRRTHDMNTANWVPDLFMKRMEARENWTLFRSNDVPDLHDLYGAAFETRYTEYEAMVEAGTMHGETIPAIELWKRMLKMLFETGHPWITFKDPSNIRSPQDHAGVVHSSNLCTEITLNTSEEETAVCNLGSVVLDNHLLPNGDLDLPKLRETIRIAVRALDNVIDINFYPTPSAEVSNKRHRPVGLGVMGLQYALYARKQAFASDEAVQFNDEMMEAIALYAYEASSDLAAERGTYSSYEGSKWSRGLLPQDTVDLLEQERGVPVQVMRGGVMDWTAVRAKIAAQGMRNSNVIAIAPTATISNIIGTSPCIEPIYRNLFSKSNLSGDFTLLNPWLVKDLKALGLWNDDLAAQLKYFDGDLTEIAAVPQELKSRYATAFQVDPDWIIDAAARRQKWIDQSQSLNLFLPQPDLKAMSHMYRKAWHSGLKTTYYLRSLGASSIEKSSVTASRFTTPSESTTESATAAVAATPVVEAAPAFPAAPVAPSIVASNEPIMAVAETPVTAPMEPAQATMIPPIITASSPLAAAEAVERSAATPATAVVDASVDADFADEAFTAEQLACSIEAMRNGGECEVCQ
ncbi:MAG: ribonucleoside-diphosphate reductase subunit alpha [Thermoleophilia bacterium]|nr:ribonucleoside-diphosphate reductase subunit alpha [Thermoleophilia bacterium]